MWINRGEYMVLVKLAAEGVVNKEQYSERLNEAKDEIDRLRHELGLERARANAAVDAMLVTGGKVPITPTEVPDPDQLFEEDSDELARMSREIADNGLVSVLEGAR